MDPSYIHTKSTGFYSRCFFYELTCKPGSVIENDHLSRPAVAGRLKPPPGDGRAGLVSPFHGVAPDRVYSVHVSPRDGWALTPPFHHHRSKLRQSISVALVRGSPLAGVTRYPCPAEPGLSSCTGFRPVPAVVQPALWGIVIIFSGQVNHFLYLSGERSIIYFCEVKDFDII